MGTWVTLALMTSDASACERVDIEIDGVEIEVLEGCHRPRPVAVAVVHVEEDEDEEPPAASVRSDSPKRDTVLLQYGMQFLPTIPGHHLFGRLVSDGNAYLGGELRYTPVSDVMWTARLGAGLDLFGKSEFDLQLGLFLGTAGEWDRAEERAVLYAAPIGGTEVGIGYEGDRIFARYRWLAGIGGGPIDDLLTENEFTLGYKILPEVHAYGQYLLLSPGEADNHAGVGLGVRFAL